MRRRRTTSGTPSANVSRRDANWDCRSRSRCATWTPLSKYRWLQSGDSAEPKTRRYTTAVVSSSIRRRALDLFAERAREILGPKLLDLRLFGSEARGEARPDSDLDVLVVVQPDAERATLEDRIVDIAFDVNLEFGLYISPRVVTRGILDDPVWRETPFLKNVVRESIPL
ncbi:MAG: hypothetical protein DMF94_30895 [Acidobacteria bacterium]|nr:MAG: hypothetical protein DMF94_30895 [Acidobacteriota bacterium]